ncbi:MAG: BT_2262 family domain-containing protein [Dysgonomonas sp.]
MKRIIYLALVCTIGLFYGCEKDSQDPSKLEYFVAFDLQGNALELVELGTTYVDAGVRAYENGKDVTSSVVITGLDEISTDAAGLYTITYTATNANGYVTSTSRSVIVYDPSITIDLSGEYSVITGTNRTNLSTGAVTAYSGYKVKLEKLVPGIYSVSDFFGGYYDKRANYGSSYAMIGYISIKADNTIDLLQSSVAGWGDSLDQLTDGLYDPSTGVISWSAQYANAYNFNVKLSK